VRKAEGLTLDQTAMIEFLSIGAHAVERAALQPGERILVAGAGPIGLAVSLFAALKGAQITVMDTRSDRLDFCREVIGVQQSVVAGPESASELMTLTDGQMFDAVFDATGNPAAMQAGFAYVAQAGRYVLVSIVNAQITFSDPEFHRREMTLLGSRNATFADVERVMDAMRAGLVPTQRLASHRASLEQLPEVMPLWMQPATGVVKALVEC
jgi:threonine dehydrogenase-like Zn-dependent dehydrogenase